MAVTCYCFLKSKLLEFERLASTGDVIQCSADSNRLTYTLVFILHCLADESDTLGTACLSTLSLSTPSGQTEPLSLLSVTFLLSIRSNMPVCKRPLEGSD